MTPEEIAKQFHDTYERLAPTFGYQTRQDTRSFDPESPNGRLMIAVCDEVLTALREKLAAAEADIAGKRAVIEASKAAINGQIKDCLKVEDDYANFRATVAAALAELRAECVGHAQWDSKEDEEHVAKIFDATIAKLGLAEQEQPK